MLRNVLGPPPKNQRSRLSSPHLKLGTQWTTGLGETAVHHSDKRFAEETLLLVRVVKGRESFSLGARDTEIYKTAMAPPPRLQSSKSSGRDRH